MSIKDRNLKVGTKLIGKYHKEPFQCEVIQGDGDKLRYRLEDGREFKSVSAAGMAITGHSCDGWTFWSLAKEESAPTQPNQETANPITETVGAPNAPEAPSASEQIETQDAPAANVEPGTAKKSIFRTPNQKGVSEGMTRWYCQACGESFLAPCGEVPVACPMGHKA